MKATLSKLRFGVLVLVAIVAAVLPMATVAAVAARVFEFTHSWVTQKRQDFALGANTLTSLIPTLYNALDVVSRELVGFIPAVTGDMTYTRAAVGQTVMSPVVPASTASDITPAVTPPNDGDQTIGNVPMTITKARRVPVRWNGEEKLGLDNNGASYNTILSNQFQQGMRTLVNEIEGDLAGLHVNASRAYGTAGTAPFGTAADLSDTAGALRILEENGAQGLDFQLVLGTAAMFNMRGKQSGLFKVNEAGREDMLRNGMTDRLQNLALRQSAQVKRHTAGTGASGTTNTAGYAVGATTITLASAGTGTIVAGDVISFAGDTNKYVVVTGDADLSNGGTVVLQAPGLMQAIPTSATAITVSAASARNMFFARSAIALATRAPALPAQGDSAIDRMVITDPLTGLSFEISMYAQYRQMQYEIAIAWGCAAIKKEHIGILLG